MAIDPSKRSVAPYYLYLNGILSKFVIEWSTPFYRMYFLSC